MFLKRVDSDDSSTSASGKMNDLDIVSFNGGMLVLSTKMFRPNVIVFMFKKASLVTVLRAAIGKYRLKLAVCWTKNRKSSNLARM